MVYEFGVYGDSIAFGYGNYDKSWFDKLFAERNAIKLAENGEKISDVWRKISKNNSSYQTLVIAVGVNDLLQPLPNNGKVSFGELLSCYCDILQEALRKADNVVVQSLLPVREELFPNQEWLEQEMWVTNEIIRDFNSCLEGVCKDFGVKYADFYSSFAESEMKEMYVDAVHLNAKGQARLALLYEEMNVIFGNKKVSRQRDTDFEVLFTG